jgi:signal transduction histidine kinase/AmiR/NasT family two-component response regulator
MEAAILRIEIKYEHDVVLARQRTRQIAALLGLEGQDQVRVATAVSELARNAFQYAGGGKIEFFFDSGDDQKLVVRVMDNGPGIANLKDILNGVYVSQTGMGLGLIGAKRLSDDFTIESNAETGTHIELTKFLPRKMVPITSAVLSDIADALSKQSPHNPFEEIQKQNQELLAALAEVHQQKNALSQLNRELEETNRGVLALSGELEQRADYQRQASELKTKFLSNITHELRTPLNSILSISGLLLDRMDGELTSEQEKQITYIKSSAESLSELVNDVLDLAKVEAGKIVIRPRIVEIDEMFGILRGMLKPLIANDRPVNLVFDNPQNISPLYTDEGKVSQILRNFISNSLKYTHAGEVRVSARMLDNDKIVFSVQDTGIGIAPEDHIHIFEEFTQIEGDHQHKVRGTGLGLPLSRKLAQLLGGQVEMTSVFGAGSTFSLIIPKHFSGPEEANYDKDPSGNGFDRYERVLIIDDNPTDRYVLRRLLENYAEEIVEASFGQEGLTLAEEMQPAVIFLDLSMPDLDGQDVLKKLKSQFSTKNIPVVIHTSKELSDKECSALEIRARAILSKSSTQKSRIGELDRILSDIVASRPMEGAASNA